MSPSRVCAFRVLERVARGGYASDLLLKECAQLEPRDAALASEIVFGCLRRQAQLDWHIDSRTKGRKLDPEVRIALRIGLYQLLHLDRVPAHAAVGESVDLVRRARKTSACGLVNAVLRNAGKTDTKLPGWPSRDVALSMPEWLLERWDAQFGPTVADRIADEFMHPPGIWVRNPSRETGLVLEASKEVPGAFRVVSGDPRGLTIQDVGSQSIVPLLDLRPGQSFLDLCSAPGNKTLQALESGVSGIACDLHLHRLEGGLVKTCPRVVLDATGPLPFRRRFDRILVDAPCSGTGTLGRNPEIRWRLKPADLTDLRIRQISILRNGLSLLAPDGILVYSTCSLEPEENEHVVAAVLAADSSLALRREVRRTPGVDPGDGFYAAVLCFEPNHQSDTL